MSEYNRGRDACAAQSDGSANLKPYEQPADDFQRGWNDELTDNSQMRAHAVALMDSAGMWTFTFGPDHVLRGGQVRLAGPEAGGISLGRYYVLVYAATDAAARARMIEVFGNTWAAIYQGEAGAKIVSKYKLQPLFKTPVEMDISALPLHDCDNPGHPHCTGWHADREG